MVKYRLLILLSLLGFMPSCDTDLDLTADYKDVTIVYALLNQADSVQFIRIQRSFLDKNTSALIIAENPDSIYYTDADLNVRLDILNEDGNPQGSIPVSRVDISQPPYNIPKDTGTFANESNIMYVITQRLDSTRNYRLVIDNFKAGQTIDGATPMVRAVRFFYPNPLLPPIDLAAQNLPPVRFLTAENGKIYDMSMIFTYEEYPLGNPSMAVIKTIEWPMFNSFIGFNTEGEQNAEVNFDGKAFFNFMASRLEEDPNLERRAIRIVQFKMDIGAEEFWNYNRVAVAQSGLTGNEALPNYTNLSDGIGLFSSRYRQFLNGVELNFKTIDTLACSPTTEGLNFLNSSGVLCR